MSKRDMTKEFVVIGTYKDKQTGEFVSSATPISSGTSKAGAFYEIADVNSRETVPGQYRVGTRLVGSMTLAVVDQAEEGSVQGQRNVKLGK